jgi:hypothetical protein
MSETARRASIEAQTIQLWGLDKITDDPMVRARAERSIRSYRDTVAELMRGWLAEKHAAG